MPVVRLDLEGDDVVALLIDDARLFDLGHRADAAARDQPNDAGNARARRNLRSPAREQRKRTSYASAERPVASDLAPAPKATNAAEPAALRRPETAAKGVGVARALVIKPSAAISATLPKTAA